MATSARDDRKLVSIRLDIWKRVEAMRGVLEKAVRRRLTVQEVLGRALTCLDDAHQRGAWLSPEESLPLLEQRHRNVVEEAALAVAAWQRANPTGRIERLSFAGAVMTIHGVFPDAKTKNSRLKVSRLQVAGDHGHISVH